MPNQNLTPARGKFFKEMVVHIRLVLRLLRDKRISPFLKIIPFGGLIYLIFPDLFIGPIDDAALLLGGSYLFVELCPSLIVSEHLRQLRLETYENKSTLSNEENVIDAEFHDLD